MQKPLIFGRAGIMKETSEVIGTLYSRVSVSFDRSKSNALINEYYIGQKNCCKYTENGIELLANLPPQLMAAQNRFCPNRAIQVAADLLEDGTLTNLRVLE